MIEYIKSVSYDQVQIIKDILTLYAPNGIDIDCCYSKGNFYKDGRVSRPKYCSDIEPLFDFVDKKDCRALPFNDSSRHCIIFDPPFLATTGKSLLRQDSSNKINKRFGVFKNEKELYQFYIDSLKELGRILGKDGVLIFKCQDKVSSGKQYITHNFIINEAEKIGLVCEDLFILLAKNRIVADWQIKNQKHARKHHSYFLIFKK